jgi:hypothetical protein
LRDPLGIPFHPVLFQILMVLTFAIHIIFVNLVIGTSLFSVYGFIRRENFWRRLSRSLVRATTVSASLAILFGVAPLLFVQVLYDPFWYTSNMLSAAWVIGFMIIIMAAYGLTYIFYLRRNAHDSTRFAAFGASAFLLFVLAGVIMHALNYQLLQPGNWRQWYMPDGLPDTAGISLHAFSIGRFFHFIMPSFGLTGIFLMLYARYFRDRADMESAFLQRVGSLGARLAYVFTVLQVLVGFWWLFGLPVEFRFFRNPVLLVTAGLGFTLMVFLSFAQKNPVKYAIPSGIAAFLAVFGMSYAREVLRMEYAGRFAYSPFTYSVNIDWGSTVLFLATFAVGLTVVSYLATVAVQSGRTSGTYRATPAVAAWGRASVAALLVWILAIVSLGVIITIRNYR